MSESESMNAEGNDASGAAADDPEGLDTSTSGSSLPLEADEIAPKRATNGKAGQSTVPSTNSRAKSVTSSLAPNLASNVDVGRLLGQQLGLTELAKKWAVPLAGTALFEQFRIADIVTPHSFRVAELAGTAHIAEMFGARSALAGWRQSLVTQQAAIAIAASATKFDSMSLGALSDLTRFTTIGASLAKMAVKFSTAEMFASTLSQPPTLSLRDYVTALPPLPSLHQLTMSSRGSHGVAGLLGVDVASTSTKNRAELENGLQQIESEVVEPWLTGPTATRAEMLDRLRGIDETVPDLLNGAWDDVSRAGPAAEVKVATCTAEALERTLRGLAPDADVLAWLSGQKHSKNDLDSHGGPTYASRARFALRERPGDRKLVLTQVEAVIAQVPELRSRLQARKHASTGTLVALRAHLVSTEAVLVQLVTLD